MQKKNPRFDARVGQHIRTSREIAGFTQVKLAKALGVSQSDYCRIESGEVRCSLYQFMLIAEALEISFAELLGDSANELRK